MLNFFMSFVAVVMANNTHGCLLPCILTGGKTRSELFFILFFLSFAKYVTYHWGERYHVCTLLLLNYSLSFCQKKQRKKNLPFSSVEVAG